MRDGSQTSYGKLSRTQEILRETNGGGGPFQDIHSESTANCLTLLVFNETGESGKYEHKNLDDKFIDRVCGKLKYDLRNLADMDISRERKEHNLLRNVRLHTQREAGTRPTVERPSGGVGPPDIAMKPKGLGGHSLREQCVILVLKYLKDKDKDKDKAKLALLFALMRERVDNDDDDSLFGRDDELDIGKISHILGWSIKKTKRIYGELRKLIKEVLGKKGEIMIPRQFREVYLRLRELAAEPFPELADVELRLTLFNISRALALSFDPQTACTRAIRKLGGEVFEVLCDFLREEQSFSDVASCQTVWKQLSEEVQDIQKALETGDVNLIFVRTAPFLLNVAHVQPRVSPARGQLLLTYGFLLRVAGWYDACIAAAQAVAERCDAIAEEKGADILDLASEFDSGETLRRVKTYAILDHIVTRFYFKVSTARQQRFHVRDYDALVALDAEMAELIETDPEYEGIYAEWLVLRAHIVRAAYNFHRTAKSPAGKKRWKQEQSVRRGKLRGLIAKHFLASDVPRRNAQHLFNAVRREGEGCAIARALDVIEEVLSDMPALVQAIRAERQAVQQPPRDEHPVLPG